VRRGRGAADAGKRTEMLGPGSSEEGSAAGCTGELVRSSTGGKRRGERKAPEGRDSGRGPGREKKRRDFKNELRIFPVDYR